jgi:hypothetical protein
MFRRTLVTAGSMVAAVVIGGGAAIAASSGLFAAQYNSGAGKLAPVITTQTRPTPAAATSAAPGSPAGAQRPTAAASRPSSPAASGTVRATGPAGQPGHEVEADHTGAAAPGREDDD